MRNDRSYRIVKRIVRRFKEIRLASEMSHEELAKKSGFSRPAISHIEGGKRKPSLLMANRIAEALGIKLSEIVREAEEEEEQK